MDIKTLLKNAEDDLQVIQPEEGVLKHCSEFVSFDDLLQMALDDYEELSARFLSMDAGSPDLLKTAELVDEAAQALLSRSLVLFKMVPSSPENRKRALEIIDRVTKETAKREKTCENYCNFMKEKNPTRLDLIDRLRKEKQKRMHFMDRCMSTHEKYIDMDERAADHADPILESEKRAAALAERERKSIPHGCYTRPPMPFPPERIPVGIDVPDVPAPFLEFDGLEPEEKEYDIEHQTFVPKKGWVSADGLLDENSVVFDWENHLVTMKYRGGVPVTWPFRQFTDPRDVPRPGEWFSDYYIRYGEQIRRDRQPGVLKPDENDREIPEYDRKPSL